MTALTAEEIEAREAEGIETLEATDARLDLARRYRELMSKQDSIKKEMDQIKLLMRENASFKGIKEYHYNGHKIVSINDRHNRRVDLDKLFKEFPDAYYEVVSKSVSSTINFSEIKE